MRSVVASTSCYSTLCCGATPFDPNIMYMYALPRIFPDTSHGKAPRVCFLESFAW